MRQDSEEKKKKDEERENIPKTIEKVASLDKQKSTEDKPHVNKSQNEKTVDQQVINVKEQKTLETEDQTQNELDSSEKIKKVESEGNGKLFDNIKRFESQQKLINNKSSSISKKQLGVNEKRKSAPVKPEMIEDLSKIIYKQSSFEDKNR